MKLLVLDKDGTLTRTKSGHTFVQHPEDQVLIDGVAEAIAAYAADGWTMAIASNQGGVAAGFKSLDDAIAEMEYAMKLIYPFLKYPQTLYFRGLLCPDDGATAWCVSAFGAQGDWKHYEVTEPLTTREPLKPVNFRKPSIGMLLEAEEYLRFSDIDATKRLMIGDRDEDRGAAVNAGFEFMHVSDWLEPFIK